jgi:hypothetical protein
MVPSGALFMFGGRTATEGGGVIPLLNALPACVSVDQGVNWLLLAPSITRTSSSSSSSVSLTGLPPQPLLIPCYDSIQGVAYLMPDDVILNYSGAPLAYSSVDWVHWSAISFPQELIRVGSNCLLDSALDPIVINGMYDTTDYYYGRMSSSSASSRHDDTDDLGWLWQDRLTYGPDVRQWIEDGRDQGGEGAYTSRYNALTTSQLNLTCSNCKFSSSQLDVHYTMGGVTFITTKTFGGDVSPVIKQTMELFDLWFSVDSGSSWWRVLDRLPWQRAPVNVMDWQPASMYGAVMTSSPSHVLVVYVIGVNGSAVWASLDGGYTWGQCGGGANTVTGVGVRLSPNLAWSSDHHGQERLLVLGGQQMAGNVTAEVWSSALDFANMTQVTTGCGLTKPQGRIGLSETILEYVTLPSADEWTE